MVRATSNQSFPAGSSAISSSSTFVVRRRGVFMTHARWTCAGPLIMCWPRRLASGALHMTPSWSTSASTAIGKASASPSFTPELAPAPGVGSGIAGGPGVGFCRSGPRRLPGGWELLAGPLRRQVCYQRLRPSFASGAAGGCKGFPSKAVVAGSTKVAPRSAKFLPTSRQCRAGSANFGLGFTRDRRRPGVARFCLDPAGIVAGEPTSDWV